MSQTTHKKLIKIFGEISVNRTPEEVFDFFANPTNDKLWRTEINKSTFDGSSQVGSMVSEYSYLSKKASNNLLELICVDFDKNKIAVFETSSDSKFYLKSHREVKAGSDTLTQVIYKLDFDTSIVKFAVGFGLPDFIISWKAKSDMKKYLRQLK